MKLVFEDEAPKGLVFEDDVPEPTPQKPLFVPRQTRAPAIQVRESMPRATTWNLAKQGWPRIHGTFGFDTETKDTDLDITGGGWPFPDNRGHIVGFGFCWGDPGKRHKMYLPIRHEGGGNLDVRRTKQFVKDTMADTSSTAVVANRLYDEGWCRREDIPIRARVFDIGTAAPLLDEYKHRYSLDALSWEALRRRKDEEKLEKYVKDYNAQLRAKGWLEYPEKGKQWTQVRNRWIRDQMIHHKEDIWQMPAHVVEDYASVDPENTVDIWDVYRPELEAQDLWGIFVLETRLLPVLLEMRWRGIRVDIDKAEQTAARFRVREAELAKQIKDSIGFSIDPWNKDDIVKALDQLGVAYGRTPTGQPSVTKAFLDSLEHPVGKLLRDARRYQRTRSQFIEKYVLEKHCRGRVYGECTPLPSEEGGAVTGRFSMSKPNLENLPNPEKDFEMGVAVRELMLPEEGELWAALDYKQQEPRLMVHFAHVMRIKGAQAAVDAYWDAERRGVKLDFHQFIVDATGLLRVYAKQINLGIGYGMGGAKLCRALGLPTEWVLSKKKQRQIGMCKHASTACMICHSVEVAGKEGQAILDQYHERAPFVRGITQECENRAKRRGYIRTLFGRRCRFAIGEGKDYHYKAANRLIQGSAADQTKKAMLDMWDAGELPKLPVHDELGCSVRDMEHAKYLAEIMTNAVTLRIPVGVDIEVGPSWGATVKQEAA